MNSFIQTRAHFQSLCQNVVSACLIEICTWCVRPPPKVGRDSTYRSGMLTALRCSLACRSAEVEQWPGSSTARGGPQLPVRLPMSCSPPQTSVATRRRVGCCRRALPLMRSVATSNLGGGAGGLGRAWRERGALGGGLGRAWVGAVIGCAALLGSSACCLRLSFSRGRAVAGQHISAGRPPASCAAPHVVQSTTDFGCDQKKGGLLSSCSSPHAIRCDVEPGGRGRRPWAGLAGKGCLGRWVGTGVG